MNLCEALLPLLPGPGGVVAFVGAGGKTTALFRLGSELARRGHPVLATTTTHLLDPRLDPSDPPGRLVLQPDLEFPFAGGPVPPSVPGLTVLAARATEPPGKVKGVHPSWIHPLGGAWPFVLVEADGARHLPVKAPAPFEPVLPEEPVLVVGIVGMDCLGRPMDERTVHRPEVFHALTGCAPGARIGWEHLSLLIRHPEGLFKGVHGPRAIFLNKADKAFFIPSPAQLAGLPADLVLLGSLLAPDCVIVSLRGHRP